MFQRLKNLLLSNLSLLIIVIGALCNFTLTLFWKENFEATFADFTLLSTFISIVISFGLLGLDQVFLRLSVQKQGKNYISQHLVILICLAGLLFPLIISGYFNIAYNLNFWLLIPIAIFLNLMVLAYNSLRLNANFTKSQIINNVYKTTPLIIVFYYFFQGTDFDFNQFLSIFILLLFLTSIPSLIFLMKSLRISVKQEKNMSNLWMSFLLNLGVLTFIGYGDRLLIGEIYGKQSMGDYFYYSTIFLFPLTLLQFYVGFKELVNFKREVNRKIIHQKILKILLVGTLVTCFIFIVILFINNRLIKIDLEGNFTLILLLSALGISKLIYGLFSALLGAVGNSKELYKISLYSLLLISIFSIFIVLYPELGISFIIIALIIVYLIRSIFIYSKIVLENSL